MDQQRVCRWQAGDIVLIQDADFEILRGHGLGLSEIMEVISMAALAVYANTIADATGMSNDEMFTQF